MLAPVVLGDNFFKNYYVYVTAADKNFFSYLIAGFLARAR